MNLDQDLVKKTISFETYQGERITNLKLLSILDPQTAQALGFDAPAKHVQNYPFLPPGTSDNWQDYMYAKFVDADNKVSYYGVPWVKPESIVINDNPGVRITIIGATQAQIDNVKSMMIGSGISNFTVETI